jgi:cytochrome c2
MYFLANVIRATRRDQAYFRQMARVLIVLGLALVVFSISAFGTPVTRTEKNLLQGAGDGKAIFQEKCSGCHSIGGGKLVGPDLKDVTKRRDLAWIKSFITDPAKMIASDSTAQALLKENNNITMPTLGLSQDQVEALVEFLGNPGAAPAAPAAAPSGAGDPAAGEKLFTGEKALANGGPPCLACHTVSGAGSLGGGALGPDLTHVVQRYGEPGLSGALKTISFPTMLGPFQNRPLTPIEQADLVAFFKDADRWHAPVASITPGALTGRALLILGLGLSGAFLLFLLLWVLWVRIRRWYGPRLPIRKISRG